MGDLIECPVCGTKFIVPCETIFRLNKTTGTEYYCKYSCYKKAKEEYQSKRKVKLNNYVR